MQRLFLFGAKLGFSAAQKFTEQAFKGGMTTSAVFLLEPQPKWEACVRLRMPLRMWILLFAVL